MIRPNLKYLIPFFAILAALAVLLFFIHPFAPLLLVLSILIQAPLVWYYVRSAYAKNCKSKESERRQNYEIYGDAEGWLALEEKDAASVAYRYWPRAYRDKNVLRRAELLIKLDRAEQAQELLEGIEQRKLSVPNLTQYLDIQKTIEAAGQGPAAD